MASRPTNGNSALPANAGRKTAAADSETPDRSPLSSFPLRPLKLAIASLLNAPDRRSSSRGAATPPVLPPQADNSSSAEPSVSPTEPVPVPEPEAEPAPEQEAVSASESAAESEAEVEEETETESQHPTYPKNHSVQSVAIKLAELRKAVKRDHATVTSLALSSTAALDHRVHSGPDLFANVSTAPSKDATDDTIRMKSKQHLKQKKDQRLEHYDVTIIKTNQDRVPPYRFHHVELKRNMLTANTSLTFSPHVRDLEDNEEAAYNKWLNKLSDSERKSGFQPLKGIEKYALMIQNERAAALLPYIDAWLKELAIPRCTKENVLKYLAKYPDPSIITHKRGATLVQQSPRRAPTGTMSSAELASRVFVDAFQSVFDSNSQPSRRTKLHTVFSMDPSTNISLDGKINAPADSQPQAAEAAETDLNRIDTSLSSFTDLGCLLCFSHSCDHGDYDLNNLKRNISIGSCYGSFSKLLRQRSHLNEAKQDGGDKSHVCGDDCYKKQSNLPSSSPSLPFSEREKSMLQSICLAEPSDPICIAATILDRSCHDVFLQTQQMRIDFPWTKTTQSSAKSLPWYDRWKKMLIGDWQDHTNSHEHQRRDIVDPCFHDGPCRPKVCSCVDAGLLCEKLCACSVENCAYKFTGCACHSQGKTCTDKQKDRPCVCRQLNRECDPDLCGSCGVVEKAKPENLRNESLQGEGCQNCDLQRGIHKKLAMGESQLEGVGYGVFAMEDIRQDDFVIEYVGELISQDEGVRREERRGDDFGDQSSTSYVFTLLDHEGLWIDAAIYGNLSRYINHAPERGITGCNIAPTILYVNGEWRIKFTALRDIKVGEEIFFNYGKHFPNLTKKLLDPDATDIPDHLKTDLKFAAQAGEQNEGVVVKKRRGRKKAIPAALAIDHAPAQASISPPRKVSPLPARRKRKRGNGSISEREDYQPEAASGYESSNDWQSVATDDGSTPVQAGRHQRHARLAKETPTPTREDIRKTRSNNRGGARPGSGRPRKQPRVVGRPTTGTHSPSIAYSRRRTTLEANEGEGSKRSTPTTRGRLPRQAAQADSAARIEDSEDEPISNVPTSPLSGTDGESDVVPLRRRHSTRNDRRRTNM